MRLLGMAGSAMSANPPLSTLELYDRWASTYPPVPHNPLMRAEQRAMLDLVPPNQFRPVLDLACGSGRYAKLLTQEGAANVVALDFSSAMLSQVAVGRPVRASMMHLPFVARAFGLVICGLAIGHATNIDLWMHEVARVIEPKGTLLYSDFHPDAARAGLTRSFTDGAGTHTLPHNRYTVASQLQAAVLAGLTIEVVREIRAGIEVREDFVGSDEFYRRWHGLPLVLVIRARRQP